MSYTVLIPLNQGLFLNRLSLDKITLDKVLIPLNQGLFLNHTCMPDIYLLRSLNPFESGSVFKLPRNG